METSSGDADALRADGFAWPTILALEAPTERDDRRLEVGTVGKRGMGGGGCVLDNIWEVGPFVLNKLPICGSSGKSE